MSPSPVGGACGDSQQARRKDPEVAANLSDHVQPEVRIGAPAIDQAGGRDGVEDVGHRDRLGDPTDEAVSGVEIENLGQRALAPSSCDSARVTRSSAAGTVIRPANTANTLRLVSDIDPLSTVRLWSLTTSND